MAQHPTEPLVVETSSSNGWTIIRAIGDLDLATAPLLVSAVPQDAKDVALDLSGIRFIDSSGLRGLLDVRSSVDGEVVLLDPSDEVRALLTLTRMTDAFTLTDGEDALPVP